MSDIYFGVSKPQETAMVYFSFEFGKWLGLVWVIVILCCICVFTLAEMKMSVCLGVQWNIRRRNEAHRLGKGVGSCGQNGPNLGVGLFWRGERGCSEGII